jgi:hypothetical protein
MEKATPEADAVVSTPHLPCGSLVRQFRDPLNTYILEADSA